MTQQKEVKGSASMAPANTAKRSNDDEPRRSAASKSRNLNRLAEKPPATFEFGESGSSADHLMPHFWTSRSDAASLPLDPTWDPARQLDLWRLSLAR